MFLQRREDEGFIHLLSLLYLTNAYWLLIENIAGHIVWFGLEDWWEWLLRLGLGCHEVGLEWDQQWKWVVEAPLCFFSSSWFSSSERLLIFSLQGMRYPPSQMSNCATVWLVRSHTIVPGFISLWNKLISAEPQLHFPMSYFPLLRVHTRFPDRDLLWTLSIV